MAVQANSIIPATCIWKYVDMIHLRPGSSLMQWLLSPCWELKMLLSPLHALLNAYSCTKFCGICGHVDRCHAILTRSCTTCRNLASAGFTPEERESFERLLLQKGFKDVFRERHPEVEAYTYDMPPL